MDWLRSSITFQVNLIPVEGNMHMQSRITEQRGRVSSGLGVHSNYIPL